MNFRIISDSCCDITSELKKKLGITIVPMSLTLGKETFLDDENLDTLEYVRKMNEYPEKVLTACPSPDLFKQEFMGEHTSFAVTLSDKLSGSFSSAWTGKMLAEEEGQENIHLVDSKSASAGELLVAMKLRQFINEGLQISEILKNIENFVDNMKTYFVLDNIENLRKSGRLSGITGKLISMMHIKPVMGADENGNIKFFTYAKGFKQMIDKLAEQVAKSGKNTEDTDMVISHCNNLNMAQKLKETVESLHKFREIFIVPTRGVSSTYANDKGIVMAF